MFTSYTYMYNMYSRSSAYISDGGTLAAFTAHSRNTLAFVVAFVGHTYIHIYIPKYFGRVYAEEHAPGRQRNAERWLPVRLPNLDRIARIK